MTDSHPLKKKRKQIQTIYLAILIKLIEENIEESEFEKLLIEEYRKTFLVDSELLKRCLVEDTVSLLTRLKKPWRHGTWAPLIRDIYIISPNEEEYFKQIKRITNVFGKKFSRLSSDFIEILHGGESDESGVDQWTKEIRENYRFFKQPVKKIAFIANVSAGKSTLINAILGKRCLHASEEVCTGNVSYIYNKPFEDFRISYKGVRTTLDADDETLWNINRDEAVCLASYFLDGRRVCLVDTPGVNNVRNKTHRIKTESIFDSLNADMTICILNAEKLGSDEEIEMLQWVKARNIKNVLFVVNKLDKFRTSDDNIADSLEKVRMDLIDIGFETPIICPVSANLALLNRLSAAKALSEDDMEELEFLNKKFEKSKYDLSVFYADKICNTEIEDTLLKTGIPNLEELIIRSN